MVAEIINVGTELITGRAVNANAAFLAEQCAQLGLVCHYQTVVGDDKERIGEVLKTAYNRADIVFITGGMGEAKGDVALKAVRSFCKKAAEIILEGINGGMNGLILEQEKKTIVLLPGAFGDMKCMFQEQVFSFLQKKTETVVRTRTVKICGMNEKNVKDVIADMVKDHHNPAIEIYETCKEVHIRVTATAAKENEANKLIKPVIQELKHRFHENIYTTHEEKSLEQVCVDLLLANDLRISTMESCTGGMVAARLINVPGVSEVFKAGYVTYSDKAKRKVLGVKRATLKKYSAVSKEVAKEMAEGVSLLTKADVTVSVTGLAGPDGGTGEKPVGLVYIGCSVKGKTVVEEYHFSGDRANIRESAVAAALILLRKCVLEYFSEVTFGNKKV